MLYYYACRRPSVTPGDVGWRGGETESLRYISYMHSTVVSRSFECCAPLGIPNVRTGKTDTHGICRRQVAHIRACASLKRTAAFARFIRLSRHSCTPQHARFSFPRGDSTETTTFDVCIVSFAPIHPFAGAQGTITGIGQKERGKKEASQEDIWSQDRQRAPDGEPNTVHADVHSVFGHRRRQNREIYSTSLRKQQEKGTVHCHGRKTIWPKYLP